MKISPADSVVVVEPDVVAAAAAAADVRSSGVGKKPQPYHY